ncbi:hypothetical protein C8F01DRAFT_1082599 [Mycena amicta]|nr:hypothetical protein C8F01DRAFT_1082599 [Mycena amicta]
MQDYGMEEDTGMIYGFTPLRVDQLRDILARFFRPRSNKLWNSLPEAITRIQTIKLDDLSLSSVKDTNDDVFWFLSYGQLHALAHVVFATQQILDALGSFENRDVQSSFILDPRYWFLKLLDGCNDNTLLTATFQALQIRLGRAEKHVRRKLWQIREEGTGQELEDKVSSFNSTISGVRQTYGTVPLEHEVWRMVARKDYAPLMADLPGHEGKVNDAIQSLLEAEPNLNRLPYCKRTGSAVPTLREDVPSFHLAEPGPFRMQNPARLSLAPNRAAARFDTNPSVISFIPGAGRVPNVLTSGGPSMMHTNTENNQPTLAADSIDPAIKYCITPNGSRW